MNTAYLKITVSSPEDLREAAIAWLAELPFEAFSETPEGIEAYIPSHLYDESATRAVLEPLFSPVDLLTELMPRQNWNEDWEKAYPPVQVPPLCQVLADFHDPEPGYEYTIRIQPQMSFGTGHHETTRLMMQQAARVPLTGARVLDMGCGTGILGILSAKMGAREVVAIDNDPWCVENTAENLRRNDLHNFDVRLGDATILPGTGSFDFIFANINLVILQADMEAYVAQLAPGGHLAISGFFAEDAELLTSHGYRLGLDAVHTAFEGRWSSILFAYQPAE